jgi:cell cycle arrest protein BUB3
MPLVINIHLTVAGFAIGSIEGKVAIEYMDPATEIQQKKYSFRCHRTTANNIESVYPVNVITYHPIHGTFATGGCDGVVNIWDGANRKRVIQLKKYPASVAALAFSEDGNTLAVASSYTFEEGEKE